MWSAAARAAAAAARKGGGSFSKHIELRKIASNPHLTGGKIVSRKTMAARLKSERVKAKKNLPSAFSAKARNFHVNSAARLTNKGVALFTAPKKRR